MTLPLPETEAVRRLHAQYETARALAESASLLEAAPKILQAICETLGWEHGALWRVDPAARVLRCVEIWHPPSVSFPAFEAASREATFARGIGLPGRVWETGKPTWMPRRRPRRQLPARGRGGPGGAARRPRHSHPLRPRGAGRPGVLQPRDPAARRCAPGDARHGGQPDRPVQRAPARRGRAQHPLPHVARHAVHRRIRRHVQAAEPGLGKHPRLHRGRADGPPLRRVRASGRPESPRSPRRARSRPGGRRSSSRTGTPARTEPTGGSPGTPSPSSRRASSTARCGTSPSRGARPSSCRRPGKPPRSRTAPRATSWPT